MTRAQATRGQGHARLATLALAIGLSACGGGTPMGPEGITLEDISGRWAATVFEFSTAGSVAFPSVDLVADGITITLDIQSNGRFTLTQTSPQGAVDQSTGSLSFDAEAEDFLLLTFDDDPADELEFFFVVVSQASFRLIDTTGEGEFDFDGDGVDEPARVNSTWVRM